MKRPDTTTLQFVQRIPADVRTRANGIPLHIQVGADMSVLTIKPTMQAIRVSTRTADPKVHKLRSLHIEGYLQSVWHALRNDEEVSLTHRQAVALAGELYQARMIGRHTVLAVAIDKDTRESRRVDPTREEDEMWPLGYLNGEADGERDVGPLVDRMLRERGVARLDEGSREMVTSEFIKALGDAADTNAKQAAGDYSPDTKAARFPTWTQPGKAEVDMMALLEAWWVEAKATGRAISTYKAYLYAFKALQDFLGHSDAAKITVETLIAYKDHRLANGISPKTVGSTDLIAFRSVFGWAVDNRKLTANPGLGVKMRKQRKTRLRNPGFEPAEATLILRHSLGLKPYSGDNIAKAKLYVSRRWVPWLCAYTGARVGEMVQLRHQDVHEEEGVWTITISPEANTVKDKELRTVVIHEHLIATGFIDFVKGCTDAYLFVPPTNDIWQTCANTKTSVAKFARQVVTDPNVQPNHGWRHAFKTVGREAGIADSVLDAICGHAPATEGGHYGQVALSTQRSAMERFPRYIP